MNNLAVRNARARDLEKYITIAADCVADLRKVDVLRVIESVRVDNIDGVTRSEIADYIVEKRPDLLGEVKEVMTEEFPAVGWQPGRSAGGPAPLAAESNGEVPAQVSGFALAADRRGELGLLSVHRDLAGAESAMNSSANPAALCVVPAVVKYATNGNVRYWRALGEPVAERASRPAAETGVPDKQST